jgi:rhamnogalacturonyl hydrolase YesR
MHPLLSRAAGAALLLLAFAGCQSVPTVSGPKSAEVLAQMERVADWQIAHPSKQPVQGWVQAAGYAGVMALADLSASPRFHDAMMAMSEANAWEPAKRVYHADDVCVGQTYLELYFKHRDARMIAPLRARFDAILAHPKDDNLDFDAKKNPDRLDKWSWCDALFMAPPAWVRMWKATGEKAYLDFAVENWWKTSAFLYDKDEHLYFRDSSYFAKREANGTKVFWGRGNGWVMGGFVRVLQLLPADHPARAKFEQQFRDMAAKLVTLQQSDGFWRASLLDPASYPAKEASGTGFYCYAFAWGIRMGLLDRATYEPAVLKAWAALNTCVQPDGKLAHVQPVGADPKKFDENSTEPYGIGAFLLAGSEIYRLGAK